MFEDIINKIENDPFVSLIKPYIKRVKAYIVGGYVRDVISGNGSSDIDLLVCVNDVESFSKKLSDDLNAHFIELDAVNKIYRVVTENKINYFDITAPIENDFETDIKRRDLTINAIAYDINEGKIVDLTGGTEDLKNGIIRGISEKNFEDDVLRILRIFRFYSKTGYKIAPELTEIAKKNAKRINEPAKERVNTELMKMFEGKYCDNALILADECGILTEILPEYKEIKKIPPNTHHHLDLFHHSIETVRQIQLIYEESKDEIKEYLNEKVHGEVKRLAYLKLGGFLHDIGKPSCWKIEEETGRHRFIGHDVEGAKLAEPVLKRLKFSKKAVTYIQNLIKYHIYPSSMVCSEGISEKTFMKFYRKTEGFTIDVIILAMADRLSARGVAVSEKTVKDNIANLTALLNGYLEKSKEIKPLEKLLDGNEISEITGIKPGVRLGEIINALKEAQIASDVVDKEGAIEFVTKFVQKNPV